MATWSPSAVLGRTELHLSSNASECESVLKAFDALVAGQSLVIFAASEPRALLRRLRAERKGLFEWSPLEAAPIGFRIQLTRRTAERGTQREIGEALAWDHDRLEVLEQHAFECLAAGDRAAAVAAWREFSLGLGRHIRFEEALLFPTFEERLGMPAMDGPTAVMRAEHRQIESLVEALDRALDAGEPVEHLRAQLRRVLGEHNLKEERVLYPATDRALDPDERDALVARIQAS